MKRRTIAARMLCILLCVALLPVVKAKTAGYRDAYNILVSIAKKGQSSTEDFGDEGKITFYDYSTTFNGKDIDVHHRAAEKLEDFVVIEYYYFSPEDAHASTVFYLYEGDEPYDYFSFRHSISGPDTGGKLDPYGFYGSQANASIRRDFSLNDSLELYDVSSFVSRSKLEADYKKDLKFIFEYLDDTLRSGNSSLSIQTLFPNISPRSVHTVGKTWTERAATCTVDGLTGCQCSACGAKFYEPIKAGHSWQLTKVDVPATEVHGSGVYTCSKCNQTKTDAICISSAFTDMPAAGNWAHAGIDWAVYNKITKGTSATTFGPDKGCTRGQVVTFLWRAAGCPAPENLNTPFEDVKPGAFYEKAVAWAVENKITSGTGKTQFSPDGICTRGQIVTFLWRFSGSPEAGANAGKFTDVKKGAFYEKAVAWAESAKITAGTTASTFSPDDTCTRAQVVTVLHRAQ